MATRNIKQLVSAWEIISDANELIEFIDSLTQQESKIMDRAMTSGLTTKEPGYLTNKQVA